MERWLPQRACHSGRFIHNMRRWCSETAWRSTHKRSPTHVRLRCEFVGDALLVPTGLVCTWNSWGRAQVELLLLIPMHYAMSRRYREGSLSLLTFLHRCLHCLKWTMDDILTLSWHHSVQLWTFLTLNVLRLVSLPQTFLTNNRLVRLLRRQFVSGVSCFADCSRKLFCTSHRFHSLAPFQNWRCDNIHWWREFQVYLVR